MNKRRKSRLVVKLALCSALMGGANTAMAECLFLTALGVTHDELKTILANAVTSASDQGGLNNPMWLTLVNRNGLICDVVFSGDVRSAVWRGSRAISATKAYTGIAFSTGELALSSANLYAPTQPEGTFYGLQESNPVDARLPYLSPPSAWGQTNDPLIGRRMGGLTVFGGGFALYNTDEVLVGGLGVSGDTSCTDHNVAWIVRFNLNLDSVPAGVAPPNNTTDNMIVDANGLPWQAFSHPQCSTDETDFTNDLPTAFPIGPTPPPSP